jgi:cytoskeletal protein CcmA (bactofilin family)
VLRPAATPAATSGSASVGRAKSSSESVIGPDDFFDGRYRSERGVRIQGNARGSIESRQYIFVESGADVEADLSAEDITVAGSFNGKIECRRKLEVTGSGKVQGQVVTALLVVHEGGLVDGELHMHKDAEQTASAEDKNVKRKT